VRLWVALYAMIWLVVLEIWLAFTPLVPPVPLYLHMALGVGILALAFSNFSALRASTVPARVKRTARATFALCLLMAVLGAAIYLRVGSSWQIVGGITLLGGIRFLHFLNAMAILSQASATAVVYDVWEEKEFLEVTTPGEIPVSRSPAKADA